MYKWKTIGTSINVVILEVIAPVEGIVGFLGPQLLTDFKNGIKKLPQGPPEGRTQQPWEDPGAMGGPSKKLQKVPLLKSIFWPLGPLGVKKNCTT